MAHEKLQSRAPHFAPTMYYLFTNSISPNNSLSAEGGGLENGDVGMQPVAYESQNWQLYFQKERYFIRNYHYNGSFQLGLTEDSVVPKMMKRSGTLAQQWIAVRQDDGTFKFHNGLLGNNSVLAFNGVPGNIQPAMQSADIGSKWSLVANPNAQPPKDPTMMRDNDDFEVEKVVSSIISSSTTVTSQPSGTSSANLSSNSSLNDGRAPAKSSSLPPGAIAGVAIGALVILALIALLAYFLWAHRKPKREQLPGHELSDEKVQYAHVGHIHLNNGIPVQLHGETVRYEMEHTIIEERPNNR